MPRFYFHLRDDLDVLDNEGKTLPNLEAARAHASVFARFEIGEMAKAEGRVVLHHRIDIEDEQHRVIDTVWFRDVIQVEG